MCLLYHLAHLFAIPFVSSFHLYHFSVVFYLINRPLFFAKYLRCILANLVAVPKTDGGKIELRQGRQRPFGLGQIIVDNAVIQEWHIATDIGVT